MPKITDRCVEEVRRVADLLEVVAAAGVQLKRSGARWVGCCPFHDEKSPSFGVTPGKGFKCFGCGKGGGDAISFVMQREGLDFPSAVLRLADIYRVSVEYEQPPQRQQGAGSLEPGAKQEGNVIRLPDGVDIKAAQRAMKRQANYERQRAAEDRLDGAWLEAWMPRVERRKLLPWSALVAARWVAGGQSLQDRAQQLATDRGWPLSWVTRLVEDDLVAWPELPWGGSRAVAFRVDGPEGEPIGYHQRFVVRGDKRWVFVPYLVAEESVHGDFQRQMRAEQVPLDADGLAGVPGLPFVLGWRAGVRFLVVAEGQWDAVTFAGACGWLEGDSAWPEGACVVGVRGASGVDTLLAYFGSWLERERPAVLVLADNDQAGRKWDTAEPMDATVPGSPLLPTFAEKLLRRPGQLASEPEWVPRARRVEVRRVAKIHGKDFNDYWKARKPSPAAMMKWLREMDYLGADGGWK